MKSILLPTKQLKNNTKSTSNVVDIERNETLALKVDSRNSSVASDVVVVERARIDSSDDLVFCVNVNEANETTNHSNNKSYTANNKKTVLTTTTTTTAQTAQAAQVIRNCSVGVSEKLKRVSSDISSKYGGGDNDEQQQQPQQPTTIKKNTCDYTTITTVDLNSTTTTENSPLLLLGSSNDNTTNDGSAKQKFLNIKKNGATLIFQKKSNNSSSTQKYIRSVEYPELDNLKKRRSLQWSNSGSVLGDKLKNRHSWYEPRFPIVIKEELFERPETVRNHFFCL